MLGLRRLRPGRRGSAEWGAVIAAILVAAIIVTVVLVINGVVSFPAIGGFP